MRIISISIFVLRFVIRKGSAATLQKDEITHSLSSILFIILVLAGLVLILIFIFQPTRLFERSRDAHRMEDLANLTNAVNLYLADNKNFNKLSTGQIYSSSLGSKTIDGQGWLPLNFQDISSGTPIANLPLDPANDLTYNYRVGVNVAHQTFEIDCVLEEGNNQKKMLEDSGNNPARYEVGTDLTILK